MQMSRLERTTVCSVSNLWAENQKGYMLNLSHWLLYANFISTTTSLLVTNTGATVNEQTRREWKVFHFAVAALTCHHLD